MNHDFISVKPLTGELKLSQKKSGLGVSITTKEIILQRPHTSYHILFKDIISIVPIRTIPRNVTFEIDMNTSVRTSFGSNYYKISTSQASVYNRKGRSERGETEFIVPLSDAFMNYFANLSGLVQV